MSKPDEIDDLNNLSNLSQDELKKKVLEWVRGNGISEKLHSQLRCDLISSFNKTLLGRYIESQFQSEYRMVLSPVILSLNTLVAEFLYAQNCHYSLSVFSTEVPFKNTLPEFEKREHFRFSGSELEDIFQGLGIETRHVCDNISTSYYKNNNKGNNSLLFFIFLNIFNKRNLKKATQSAEIDKINFQQSPENLPSGMSAQCKPTNLSQKEDVSVDKRNLKYINKYLYIIIKKIYKLAKKIDKLEITNSNDYLCNVNKVKNQKSPHQEQYKNLENLLALNKSLENLTNEFKKLMNVDKMTNDSLDYNFVLLIKDVIRITNNLNEKFEICNHNVSLLVKYFTEGSKTGPVVEKEIPVNFETVPEPKLRYKEWLQSIKESKHGQKFLKKLEANFTKSLIKEKRQRLKDFEERLEKEKSLIKLHYRKKYLEHLTKKTDTDQPETQINALQGFIEKNTKFIEQSDRVLLELNKKTSLENTNIDLDQNNRQFSKQCANLTQHPVYNISIEPIKVEEVTQTVVPNLQLHHHIEDLVLDAKKRIYELDKESDQLDQDFQNYLHRQISEKFKYKVDISKIWQKYNSGRVVLSSKSYNLLNNNASNVVLSNHSENTKNLYSSPKIDNKQQNKNQINQTLLISKGLIDSRVKNDNLFANSPVDETPKENVTSSSTNLLIDTGQRQTNQTNDN